MVNAAEGSLPPEQQLAGGRPSRQSVGSCFSIDVAHLGRGSLEPTPRFGQMGATPNGPGPYGPQFGDGGYVTPHPQEWLAQRMMGTEAPPGASMGSAPGGPGGRRHAGVAHSPRRSPQTPSDSGSTAWADSFRMVTAWQAQAARESSGLAGPSGSGSGSPTFNSGDTSDRDVFDVRGLQRYSVAEEWSSDEEEQQRRRAPTGASPGSTHGSGRGYPFKSGRERWSGHSASDRQRVRTSSRAAEGLAYDGRVTGGSDRAEKLAEGRGDSARRSRREVARTASGASSGGRSNGGPPSRSRTPPRGSHYRRSDTDAFEVGGARMGEEGRRGEDMHASAPNFLMASRTSIYDTTGQDSIFGSMYDIVIPPSPLDVQESQQAREDGAEPTRNKFSCMPGKSNSKKQGKRGPLKWFMCGTSSSRLPTETACGTLHKSLQRSLQPAGSADLSQSSNSRDRDRYKGRQAVLRNRLEAALGDQKKGRSTGVIRGISDDFVVKGGHAMQGQDDLDTAFSGVVPVSPYAGSAKGTGRTVSIQRGQAGGMRWA